MTIKRKVVLLHHSDELGGAGVSLCNLIEMLRDRYQVSVYLPHRDSSLAGYLAHRDIVPRYLENPVGMVSCYSGGPRVLSRTFARNLWRIGRTRRALKNILMSEDPDIVAVNSIVMVWAGRTIRRSGRTAVCFVRETAVDGWVSSLVKRSLSKWFDGVIYISDQDRRIFGSEAPVVGIVRDSIRIDEYDIGLTREEACRQLRLDPGAFNLLFVGGTEQMKGWHVVSAAMLHLNLPDIKLIVAGRVDERATVANPRIFYLGVQQDMPKIYRACDVLVFPSISPHQARPVFEAGAMGIPVIISDFSATADEVVNGLNGLTFRPGDPRDLARAVMALYKSPADRLRYGAENRRLAIARHGYEQSGAALLNIFTALHDVRDHGTTEAQ